MLAPTRTLSSILALAILVLMIPTAAARADAALTPVPIQHVRIEDPFWSPKRAVWQEVTIADCLDKFEKDGAFANFDRIRDGKGGDHSGPPWYDGLVYETITGAADFMAENPDPALKRRIDGYIQRIAAAAAKDPDGYLNTYTQLKEPTHRWGANGGNDRWQHDMYNAGCLVEAGVHYYRATGDTRLLQVAARLANLMCDTMGPPPRKNLIPGHALGEMALTEMYTLFREQPDLKKQIPFPVDETRYLSLARFWIDNRGNHTGRTDFGAYDQDDVPVVQQPAIEGHAVRATLMATGLTALASITGRDDYRAASRRLWRSMTERRMYVTGGVGAVAGDEKFGDDYFLPNDGYLETCAAVGAGFFDHQINLNTANARGANELERELYNGALCGVSLAGNHYFYQNPLEAGRKRQRWAWHPCPCCPPMFLKLMGAFPGYIYATDATGLYVNLYAGSVVQTTLAGKPVSLKQTTRYPWSGSVRLSIQGNDPAEYDLNLRVPGWCQAPAGTPELYAPVGRPTSGAFQVTINGQPAAPAIVNGYAKLHRRWSRGDVVEITMQMPPRRLSADPRIAADAGHIALSLGPVVYCIESIDNQQRISNLSLPDDSPLQAEFRPGLLGGVSVIRARAMASFVGDKTPRPVELTAIPYYANANRGPVSMCVWLPRSPKDARPASAADLATPSASHTNPSDTLDALNDVRLPSKSDDESIPRFTWWDHRGTAEWVQYTFDRPQRLSAVSVYWWDERRIGRHCRVPASWQLLYRTPAGDWAPVPNPSGYGTRMDQFNRVSFDPVETTALRIEVKLQPQWSGGILEWQVEQAPAKAGK